jgi:Helix-turn-helix domain
VSEPPYMLTLTLEQAADFLHMHPQAVMERARSGMILAAKPGRRWVFLRSDLEDYQRKLRGDGSVEDAILARATMLHEGPAIYFLLIGKEIVYVGRTTNLIRRLGDHAFRKKFDGFSYLPCSAKDLRQNERAFIATLKPRYNVRLPLK